MSLAHEPAPAAALCPGVPSRRRAHASFHPRRRRVVITQSAVSRHIRTLEHFGRRLFERSGRHLQLTETARGLLPGMREGF